ncbi:MAG: proline dehydrogenase family protein [bacterium]
MLSELLAGAMPLVPRPIMRRIAGRYIAGETQDEALAKLTELAGKGYSGIFDILGEGAGSEQHARNAARDYESGARAIAAAGLDAYISIKPTHMGLTPTDDSLALELYSHLARVCAELGLFLRVEMEDHTTCDGTLRIFEQLRGRFDAVGIVLQSRLLRTPQDIADLSPTQLDVRLVKGIYIEPEAIAHTQAAEISDAFVAAARDLIARGGVRLCFATHDGALGDRLIALVQEHGLAPDTYEFQVLLGVQEPLWQRWRSAGHAVRVYVPFGPEWRSYSQRRLGKNPALFKAVLRNLLPL